MTLAKIQELIRNDMEWFTSHSWIVKEDYDGSYYFDFEYLKRAYDN